MCRFYEYFDEDLIYCCLTKTSICSANTVCLQKHTLLPQHNTNISLYIKLKTAWPCETEEGRGGGGNPNQKNIWFFNTNNLIRKKPTIIEGKNVYVDCTLSKKTLHSENFHLDLFQENIMLIFNLDKLWINISKFSVSFQT